MVVDTKFSVKLWPKFKNRVILNMFQTYFIWLCVVTFIHFLKKSCKKVDNKHLGVRKIYEFLQPCFVPYTFCMHYITLHSYLIVLIHMLLPNQ